MDTIAKGHKLPRSSVLCHYLQTSFTNPCPYLQGLRVGVTAAQVLDCQRQPLAVHHLVLRTQRLDVDCLDLETRVDAGRQAALVRG